MNTQKSITQDFPSAPELSPQVKTQTPQAGSKMERGCESTPGPWFPRQNSAGSWEVKIASGMYAQSVACMGTGCPDFFRGDPEANARLIAAAPALLEALEMLMPQQPSRYAEAEQYDRAMWENAHAAILAATGKEAA